ncbi:pilus assembly protein PilM [Bacteroidales bacterium OttesenSCG-928-M06]|nr:pilus assembly protein PilM [Bacteroidales bacterium OttesenSCG-928-M06]
MEQREYVAALDLGTSKILAMAASKDSEGVLTILATEKELSGTSIRRGVIYNVEDAANKVSSLISELDYKLRPKLKKIYVGIGGQSLRTMSHTIKKEMHGKSVDAQTINDLYEECRQYQPELAEILDIVSPEYFLDGHLESNPVGVPCQIIEVRFQLILGRPSLKATLRKSVEEKSKVEIAGFLISPLATAQAVLTSREKELGCALIEFGAGVTYLSVYKGGLLRHLVAIPLGGNVITKDLCSANLLEVDAENLKINKGNALSEGDKEELTDIIIEARMNEILANVIEQIRNSGYGSSLVEGIIITGGAALLKNLRKSIETKTNLPVRLATVNKSLISIKDANNSQVDDPASTTIFGLLMLSTENCAKEVLKWEPKPEKEFSKGTGTIDLFGEEEQAPPTKTEPGGKRKKEKEPKKKGGFLSIFNTQIKKGVEGFARDLFEGEETNTDE